MLNCVMKDGEKTYGTVFSVGSEDSMLKHAVQSIETINEAKGGIINLDKVNFTVRKGDEVLKEYSYEEVNNKIGVN